jgi:glycosyltransferase involved in cell wall biosynthesis
MQLVVSHPTGNTFVKAIIESLWREGMLSEFNTSLAIDSNSYFLNLMPEVLKGELRRRSFPIPLDKISSNPSREILRLLLPKIGLKRYIQDEKSIAGIDAVYKKLDHDTAKRLSFIVRKNTVDAVYAYEDGALETFRKAKELGLKCIYDLPIAYWEYGRALMKAEADRLPEWAITFKGGIHDSQEKLERKVSELELADMVVVPGGFVMDSLPDWSKKKVVHIAPFGSPTITDLGNRFENQMNPNSRLRVLFAGSMGQRKGLGDLFAAMNLLNTREIELIVMGSLQAPMDFYRKQFSGFTYEAGRPHEEVLALMKTCDVFCLPSIVEGRALVMQEAMSQGLPLIITPNTGGQDLIIEGKTGFLVPTSSPQAIADKLNWFVENRSEIKEMGIFAQQHAAKYTWDGYANSITQAIKSNFSVPELHKF